ncbi:MAG: TraB/GumN family protein [Bacteroidetes bacterium]|jgi:uncharacterized protein YbaP (TraB family)|nr:TraB/GumN family protein [Bacteroidota bacterium]
MSPFRKHLLSISIFSVTFLVTILTPLLSQAQDSPKKYPSLLWEISGNGAEKPSYLYGTMHVSSKLAFHLGDTFFMALESCDYVALESDATTWLSYMFGMEYMEETGGLYRTAEYHRDFYRDAFKFEEVEKKVFGSSLNFSNRIMNGMLYRKSSYAADFEEETYLDMYIHQAGEKLNKKIIGLEDFMESQRLTQQADIPDDDEKDKPKNLDYRKLINSGKSPREMLEDAYRSADLDMVDSLQRIISPSKNHQKYMLHIRNQNMADKMDSIIQAGKTLFSGVGAAHLAGEKGVIEMLRTMGYKVRPVTRNIGDYSKNYRDKLEKTYVKRELKTYTTSDNWIEVKLPGKLFEMPSNQYYKMYFYPDMSNGTNYSLIRLRYHGVMRNQTKEYMIKRIDSLLYENIPGKILEQKEIERNGYPGFDIINRTKKSDYQRYLIFATPVEMIVFKVGGTLDYVKDNNNLEEIFSSFKINGTEHQWQTHTSPYGFSIDLPGTPITDEKNTDMKHLFGNAVELFAVNGDDFYSVKRASYHDQSYIEEDTFELSYIATQFQDDLKHKEIKRSFLQHKGLQAMKTTCKDSLRFVHALYMLDGPRYYQILAKTGDSIWPDKFFNSFSITAAQPIRTYSTFEDTTYYYSVKSNTKRSGYSAFDLKEITSRIRNKENDRNYDGNSDYIYYGDMMSDEEVYLYFRQFSRYYYRPSYDSLWRGEKHFFTRKGLVLNKEKMSKDSNTYSFVLTDTNSIRKIHVQYRVNGGVLYGMRYVSEIGKTSEFGNTFFETFKPQEDTVVGLPFNQNKGDIFLEDLYGEDSLAKDYALQSMQMITFDKKHTKRVIDIIDGFKHKDFGVKERVRLIEQLGYLKHRAIMPYLESVYNRSVDTAQIQVAVLQALVNQRSKSATKLFAKLLESETPLVSQSSVEYLTSSMSDSLIVYRDLFPFLLKFTGYPEYKTGIYVLMADMLDSNVLKPKDYKSFRKDLVREAKDGLKRVMAESHSESGYDSYSRYSYSSSSHSEGMEAYNKLLIPFKNAKDVKEYFERTKRLNSKPDLLNTSLQMLEAGIDVEDTIWGHFANQDKYLIKLYVGLKDIGKEHLIPDSCLVQKKVARGLLYRYVTIEDEDSVQFLKRVAARTKDTEGYIYIFKKKDKYNEAEWNYDYVGVLPQDSTIIPTITDVRDTGNDYLDDEDLDEKMEDAVEDLLYTERNRVKKKNQRYNYYGY